MCCERRVVVRLLFATTIQQTADRARPPFLATITVRAVRWQDIVAGLTPDISLLLGGCS